MWTELNFSRRNTLQHTRSETRTKTQKWFITDYKLFSWIFEKNANFVRQKQEECKWIMHQKQKKLLTKKQNPAHYKKMTTALCYKLDLIIKNRRNFIEILDGWSSSSRKKVTQQKLFSSKNNANKTHFLHRINLCKNTSHSSLEDNYADGKFGADVNLINSPDELYSMAWEAESNPSSSEHSKPTSCNVRKHKKLTSNFYDNGPRVLHW